MSSLDPGLECQDDARRHLIRKSDLNGLDYVEVSGDQKELTVFFLGQAPESLAIDNVRLEGCQPGARPVQVIGLRFCLEKDEERDDCLHLSLDRPGDFSTYRLCVVEIGEDGQPTGRPFPGFDPRYACLEVDFKIGCPSDLDCQGGRPCPPAPRDEPAIDYLAKDYASLRQLMLDRLALVAPDWRERHVPDLGLTLVELLAYTGDHLSYYQDAVGTEAYLDTARRRTSVRRHVRLVDYAMHEGCNARAWVVVWTDAELTLADGDFCITGFAGGPPPGRVLTEADDLQSVPHDRYQVFAPVFETDDKTIGLRPAHNEIPFHTWGDGECCLPRGATRATLRHDSETEKLALRPGDLLLFEEVLGPKTGQPGDADPAHKHVVRLTRATPGSDALLGKSIVEIEWAAADALPFPLCLSARVAAQGCAVIDGISVARGNVFLVDHGRRVTDPPAAVPSKGPAEPRCDCGGRPAEVEEIAGRFRPRLAQGPLTFRQPFPQIPQPLAGVPATGLLDQDPARALPEVWLAATHPTRSDVPGTWTVRQDLLASDPGDAHFVAEVDDDGRATLRFGDGECGRAPVVGTVFTARYRVGNGPAGNVGAGAIRHLVTRALQAGVTVAVRNPFPARGGQRPQAVEEVRQLAPHAFRQDLERAITADDYARLVERDFAGRVARAAAVLRWTGSWYEALVLIDPVGGAADAGLCEEIRQALFRYRRIGHDVAVRPATTVALELKLQICVLSGYLRGHVKAALLDALSSRALAGGGRGFFHPDNLTFGQGIAFSRVIAAAQAVTGVESAQIVQLSRFGQDMDETVKANGFLPIGPLEIARLDDDPRFPGNGRLQLDLRGGR